LSACSELRPAIPIQTLLKGTLYLTKRYTALIAVKKSTIYDFTADITGIGERSESEICEM